MLDYKAGKITNQFLTSTSNYDFNPNATSRPIMLTKALLWSWEQFVAIAKLEVCQWLALPVRLLYRETFFASWRCLLYFDVHWAIFPVSPTMSTYQPIATLWSAVTDVNFCLWNEITSQLSTVVFVAFSLSLFHTHTHTVGEPVPER